MKSLYLAVFAVLLACACAAMTGGIKNIDANDPGVLNAAKFAVTEHNRGRNDMYRWDMVRVVNAQSQVVSGMKYTITVSMGRTNCRKSSESQGCGMMTDTNERNECTFTVWSRPWLPEIKVLKDTCLDSGTSI